jgi:hypothetical protein
MNGFWGHLLTASAAALGATIILSACVHDDSSVFIFDALAPPTSSTGGMCIYTSDPTQPSLSYGTLDASLSNTYVAELLVGNQLISQANSTSARTETSDVEIQGAVVTIDDEDGNQLTSYTFLTSTTVDAAQGSTPSYSPVSVVTVDPNTVANLKVGAGAVRRVTSYIRAFGQTLGGQHVESNDFEFPVNVCNGCLIEFPTGVANPAYPFNNCLSTSATVSSGSTPCIIGQDEYVACTLCVATDPCACGGIGSTVGGVCECANTEQCTAIVDAGGGG